MRNQLKRHFDLKVSHQTILNWIYKYVLKVHNFVEKLGYNLSSCFYADETVIKRENKKDNFWCCFDWGTRLITVFYYSLSCNPKESTVFINKSIKKGKPKFIQTDAGVFYPKVFHKLFYSNKIKGLAIEHKIQDYTKTKIHNYKIEMLFMKIKDRVDDFKGLKALWSAPILLTGLVIQHNFIEEYTTLKNCPCNLAGQDLEVGNNRWIRLIKMTSI